MAKALAQAKPTKPRLRAQSVGLFCKLLSRDERRDPDKGPSGFLRGLLGVPPHTP